MKHLLSIIVAICFLITTDAEAQDYSSIKTRLHDWYGINYSFNEEQVKVLPKQKLFNYPFYFNAMPSTNKDKKGNTIYKNVGGRSVYNCCLMIRVDDNCFLFTRNMEIERKPHVDRTSPVIPADNVYFENILLNNCDLPWFHIDHTSEVLNDKKAMAKITKAKDKNIHRAESDDIRRVNAENGYITRFPYVKRISCDESIINDRLHKSGVKCYGVEFNRTDRYGYNISMLVFIEKGGKSIDDYVEQISHYVRFDPDFQPE